MKEARKWWKEGRAPSLKRPSFRKEPSRPGSHKSEEEAKRIATVKAYKLAEKKSQELTAKLTEAKRGKKSVEAALDKAKRQAKVQRKQLHQAEDELSMAISQIKMLIKKLEEAEKAKEQAEQDGHEVGVAETEEALRVEVSEVCRLYCLQVWNEALDQAGVEASSALRRAENAYYPPAIRASGSSGSKADTASKEVDEGKESPTKVLPIAHIPPPPKGGRAV
ncbi:hypothetical protein SO802_032728 [Lithocarpus litseifolius]|uniref:Uncharacterized protein n=1 Tax=Lithocarpus litseifolius TaxID=425828 RepID=A0AAW2BCL4_9ROSI